MEKGGIILIVAAVVIAIVAGAFFYLTGSPDLSFNDNNVLFFRGVGEKKNKITIQ